MSFVSASQPVPGKRPGKQNRPYFGFRGSTEAPKASPLDGARLLALRPVLQATNGGLGELPMPKAAQSPLLYAFCCFPGFRVRGGEAKTAPQDRFYPLDFPREIWSGRRDSNPTLAMRALNCGVGSHAASLGTRCSTRGKNRWLHAPATNDNCDPSGSVDRSHRVLQAPATNDDCDPWRSRPDRSNRLLRVPATTFTERPNKPRSPHPAARRLGSPKSIIAVSLRGRPPGLAFRGERGLPAFAGAVSG